VTLKIRSKIGSIIAELGYLLKRTKNERISEDSFAGWQGCLSICPTLIKEILMVHPLDGLLDFFAHATE